MSCKRWTSSQASWTSARHLKNVLKQIAKKDSENRSHDYLQRYTEAKDLKSRNSQNHLCLPALLALDFQARLQKVHFKKLFALQLAAIILLVIMEDHYGLWNGSFILAIIKDRRTEEFIWWCGGSKSASYMTVSLFLG